MNNKEVDRAIDLIENLFEELLSKGFTLESIERLSQGVIEGIKATPEKKG